MEVPTLSALISCAKVKLAWSETWLFSRIDAVVVGLVDRPMSLRVVLGAALRVGTNVDMDGYG